MKKLCQIDSLLTWYCRSALRYTLMFYLYTTRVTQCLDITLGVGQVVRTHILTPMPKLVLCIHAAINVNVTI